VAAIIYSKTDIKNKKTNKLDLFKVFKHLFGLDVRYNGDN